MSACSLFAVLFSPYSYMCACTCISASYFRWRFMCLADSQPVSLLSIWQSANLPLCCLFSHLLRCLNLSICPVSLCLVSQVRASCPICLILISSFRLPFAFPDPSFQCAVRQVCVGQWLCHFLDASYPDGLGDIFNPAPCLSLCSAHGGSSQAHWSLWGAQSHRLLSPQSRGRVTGQKQPVMEHEEPEDDWGKMGKEKEGRLHGEQTTRVKKYPPPNLFHKKTHLPVHVTFYVLTFKKAKKWLDTFSSFLIDLHLLWTAKLLPQSAYWPMSKISNCPGVLKGNNIHKFSQIQPLNQEAYKCS